MYLGESATHLEKLREKNPGLTIHTVDETLFSDYARIVTSPVFSSLSDYIDKNTVVTERNVYVADIPELHTAETDAALSVFFGGMKVQIGYCNGCNFSMNGVEYHKSPELTIAITDCLMWWTNPKYLVDFNHVDSSASDLFFIPAGCSFLLNPSVLHLAPCRVDSNGYKTVIILPFGTNMPIEDSLKQSFRASGDPEASILHMTNKYMITHKDWEPLVKQNVHIGLTGQNRSVRPIDS